MGSRKLRDGKRFFRHLIMRKLQKGEREIVVVVMTGCFPCSRKWLPGEECKVLIIFNNRKMGRGGVVVSLSSSYLWRNEISSKAFRLLFLSTIIIQENNPYGTSLSKAFGCNGMMADGRHVAIARRQRNGNEVFK